MGYTHFVQIRRDKGLSRLAITLDIELIANVTTASAWFRRIPRARRRWARNPRCEIVSLSS